MLTASIVTISAVVLAYQLNLPRLWSGFQIIGDGTGEYDFAANAVVLGTILIAFTTLINALGVKLMAMINSAGVFIELIAACLIAIILAAQHRPAGRGVLLHQRLRAGESGGYLGAFLIASLASGYVMYGFDTASSLGEETVEPRRTAPEGDPAGDPGVVRHRRRHPGVRGDVGTRSQRSRRSARAAAACSTSSSR